MVPLRLQNNSWAPFAVLSCMTAILLAGVGIQDFQTRGEAREALVVQGIVNTGNWLHTSGYSGVVASKPPLFHWLAAALSLVLGSLSEFSIRSVSTLSSGIFIGICLLAIRRHLSTSAQVFFVVLLGFSFEWLRASISARVDMVHSASLAAGLFTAFHAVSTKSRLWLVGSAVLLGCAVLAKGPVGIVIPTAIFSVWVLSSRTFSFPTAMGLAGIIFGSLIVGGSWYLVAITTGSEELSNKVWSENIGRFTGEESPHRHSFIYLIGVSLLGLLPWSGVYAVQTLIQRKLKLVSADRIRTWWLISPEIDRFCFIAACTIFIFYCFPASKRSVYVLAAYPFIFFLVARHLQKSSTKRVCLVLGGCLLAGVSIFQFANLPRFLQRSTSERKLAIEINRLVPPTARVFSHGYEFYGASFYAERAMFRFEDTVGTPAEPSRIPLPNPGDVIVAFDRDISGLQAEAAGRIEFTPEFARSDVDGDTVRFFRVIKSGVPPT